MAWQSCQKNKIPMTICLPSVRSVAALLAVLLAFATPASGALSDDDNACLGCHGQEGLSKSFGKGESLPLRVDGTAFEGSVHAPLGCAACHADVDLKTHPGSVKSFDTVRAFSVAKAAVCQQCHEDAFKQHEGSVHAKRIREGSTVAPICTGCHGAHAVTPKTAYQTCVGCHSAALAAHQKWLPNAALHQEVVSCAACHAPAALRMLDLRLYDPATKTWVAEKPGEPWFEKLAKSIDADGNGFGARELLDLVRKINPEGTAAPKAFRGRIELRSNVEAHRLSDKSGAIRDCDGCHRAGAEPFRNVTVSVTGPDGRPLRHAAKPEILDSASAVASLPEFYAIGGTRSTLLDVLFVLALFGGAGFPLVHLSVRWLFRKYRAKGGA
jgi:hypothetical protein